MRLPVLLCLAAFATSATAQEIKAGDTEGTWKGGKWALSTPGSWTREEGAKFGLWVTVIPPTHEAKQYLNVWKLAKLPLPASVLILDFGISPGDWRPLIEKTQADYGLDTARTILVGYGEPCGRAVVFNSEHPDVLAGMVLLQPLIQQNVSVKPGGRATPVFLQSDTGCTYAPTGAVRSFRDQLEGLGYVARMEEVTDPANPDGWPKDMTKFLSWSLDLRPFAMGEVWDAAAAALPADSKAAEWRPRVRDAVKAWRRQFGDCMTGGSDRAVDSAISVALKDAVPVVRELKAGLKNTVAVVEQAKGKKIEANSVVICASGDLDTVEDSIVICSGDLKVQKATRSVFIVKGALTIAKDATAVVIHCGGRLKAGALLEDATVLAVGGAEGTGKAKGCVWVNTKDLKFKSNEAPRDAAKRRLEAGK